MSSHAYTDRTIAFAIIEFRSKRYSGFLSKGLSTNQVIFSEAYLGRGPIETIREISE